jgi:AraC-like DNA-binding protein
VGPPIHTRVEYADDGSAPGFRFRPWPLVPPPDGDLLIAWRDGGPVPDRAGAVRNVLDGAVLLHEPRDVAGAVRRLQGRGRVALLVEPRAWREAWRMVTGDATPRLLPPLLCSLAAAGAAVRLGQIAANQPTSNEVHGCWLGLIEVFAGVSVDEPSPLPPELDTPTVSMTRRYLLAAPGEEMSLDDLVRETGLSKYHLVHALGQTIGLPPHQFRLRMRLWRARRLLERGDTVATVAQAAGFADQSHFTSWFRRVFGFTPMARYRRR